MVQGGVAPKVDVAAWGGAGGYVVLQGVQVAVSGNVFANGGGGGCGYPGGGLTGNPGEDGVRNGSAPVACVPGGSAGAGGTGGSKNFAPGNGGGTTGGGGGSMGVFQAYTPAGVIPTLTPATSSPNFQPNLTIPTK